MKCFENKEGLIADSAAPAQTQWHFVCSQNLFSASHADREYFNTTLLRYVHLPIATHQYIRPYPYSVYLCAKRGIESACME